MPSANIPTAYSTQLKQARQAKVSPLAVIVHQPVQLLLNLPLSKVLHPPTDRTLPLGQRPRLAPRKARDRVEVRRGVVRERVDLRSDVFLAWVSSLCAFALVLPIVRRPARRRARPPRAAPPRAADVAGGRRRRVAPATPHPAAQAIVLLLVCACGRCA